ncbi:MAG: phosphoribosylglycinamide formyltransferase 2 [Epsilonproteobacteria bacterium]|jgi:phosphoribosylglycinamide formyltransferase 2|nr:phosphoribosylglycinamide formyltransferase 2 [Campylobacterota bacterium]NPA88743.1 formate-dependent phosphoribosylglycinamide formyltransferase [Campylobacterota bacterium]
MELTTPLKSYSTKILLLGSGELGKEVAIEATRLGCEVVAVDRYPNPPASLVAQKSYTIDMKNYHQVLEVIEREKPTYILPEIEAINIDALFEAEKRGYRVIPNAEAVNKTMNRKNIRKFVAEELGLKTSKYRFVSTLEELRQAVEELGYPAVVKPVMSSSGHGQSIVRTPGEIEKAWNFAREDARGSSEELIVEEFINFDYEITLLTVQNDYQLEFCPPIGHIQKDGDYIFSWQPMEMKPEVLEEAQNIARKVVEGLGGRGIFGVEMFIKGDEVYFSEVSPRPHDTGLVTLITQSQSEFALHIRAVLNLPLEFQFLGEGASGAIKSRIETFTPKLKFEPEVFSSNSRLVIFGKPEAHKGRRMGVVLVSGADALRRAQELVQKVEVVG